MQSLNIAQASGEMDYFHQSHVRKGTNVRKGTIRMFAKGYYKVVGQQIGVEVVI